MKVLEGNLVAEGLKIGIVVEWEVLITVSVKKWRSIPSIERYCPFLIDKALISQRSFTR